jgi:glutamate--cysteine ligase
LRLKRLYRRGVRARARLDRGGDDERGFLTFLDGVLANGTPAEQLLEAYHGRRAGKVDPVFEEFSY